MREDDAVSERPTLLDALVDLAVYAPVGLALTAAEELPELIAKGRSRIEPQLGTARLVGQFVVAEGRRRVIRYGGLGGVAARPRPADRAASGEPNGQPTGDGSQDGTGSTAEDSGSPASPQASARGATGSKKAAGRSAASGSPVTAQAGATDDVPNAASLAIPGYDSLSASQVVQRLAGLSPSELAAVGRYEAATRGRRTILARVSQLQGD